MNSPKLKLNPEFASGVLSSEFKIFFTGKRNSGKSTLLKALQSCFPPEAIGGFLTLPFYRENFQEGYEIVDLISGKKKPVGIFNREGRLVPVTAGFESVGVESLDNALFGKKELLIMDELGFLEEEALEFQGRVLSAISGFRKVLGVIKANPTAFLNRVKQISGVKILEVAPENRRRYFLVG